MGWSLDGVSVSLWRSRVRPKRLLETRYVSSVDAPPRGIDRDTVPRAVVDGDVVLCEAVDGDAVSPQKLMESCADVNANLPRRTG